MSLRRKLDRMKAQMEAQDGVHLLHMARPTDPTVFFCGPCNAVTVLRADEDPRCGKCAKPLCDGCKQKLREDASAGGAT